MVNYTTCIDTSMYKKKRIFLENSFMNGVENIIFRFRLLLLQQIHQHYQRQVDLKRRLRNYLRKEEKKHLLYLLAIS
jgi:hypothetical protein